MAWSAGSKAPCWLAVLAFSFAAIHLSTARIGAALVRLVPDPAQAAAPAGAFDYVPPLAPVPAGAISAIEPLPPTAAGAAQPDSADVQPVAAVAEVVAPEASDMPEALSAAERWRVTASGVNIRSEPSGRSDKLGVVRRGDVVAVLERDGNWLRLAYDGGIEAWVFARYLAPAEAEAVAALP